jgi:hypothetical protein
VFKIEQFRVVSGKIRMVIETDCASSASILRFFSAADAFAQAYHVRFRSAIAADRRERDPDRIRTVEEERFRRARYLALYRQLPGSRRERLKALREYAAADGHPLGYDAAIFLVARAGRELSDARRARIGQLRESGHSVRSIAAILSIPRSTVDRLSAPGNGDRRKCPRIDDLAPGLPTTPDIFSCSHPGSKNQGETASPAAGAV